MTARRRLAGAAMGLAGLGLAGACGAAPLDPLVAGFLHPPQSARPLVFWHWMNGEISLDGIDRDLAWMKRAGLGGAQIVEVDLNTPPVLAHRRIMGEASWRSAVRRAARTARRLKMALGVATSAGWSSTGGPWVAPAQAMKKLVWSTLAVDGQPRSSAIVLPPLPHVAGPFQTVAGWDLPAQARAPFAVDVAVLAYRAPPDADPDDAPPPGATSSAGPLDAAALTAGDAARAQTIALSPKTQSAWIRLDVSKARTVRAVTLGLPGPRGFGAPPPAEAWLEASEDGQVFHRIADLPAGMAQERTATFAPVTARAFRLVLQQPPAQSPPGAPGVIPMPLAPAPVSVAVSQFRLSGEARVNRFEEKAGFATALDYRALATPSVDAGSVIPKAGVLDLTSRLRADGSLDWRPPPGAWVILRLGYSLTGQTNGPAAPELTGLEADKLDPSAVQGHLDRFLSQYETALGGSLRAGGVSLLLADSIEAGPQTWTPHLRDAFRRRRGYDPTPWLPALTGAIVDSAAASDRFLWDFRQTIAELYVDGQSAAVAQAAHRRGLQLYSEALEDHRPQLGDDMAMRRFADAPMGAMWTFDGASGPRPTYVADLQGAASVAHIYGRPLVAAESMTAFGSPWGYAPRQLKPVADRELALGVNQFVIHSSVHQPLADAPPGVTLAAQLGQDFNRNETWAGMARPWIDYLARSAFLMRQGRAAADVAYVYGQDAPLTALYGDAPVADAPRRNGFDFVDADVVLHDLRVREGRLETSGGAAYRLLYLGGSSQRMTSPLLKRLQSLVEAGAVVLGPEPLMSPSLADDQTAFKALADSLWQGATAAAGHTLGRGRVLSGRSVDQALLALGVGPDVAFTSGDGALLFAHRRLARGDIYFVLNTTDAPLQTQGRFAVRGWAPELWRADSGRRELLSYRQDAEGTVADLTLAPHDAVFVVFRRKGRQAWRAPTPAARVTSQQLSRAWQVTFQPDRGAPSHIRMPRLTPWNENADPGVRYFSGAARYATTFDYRGPTGDGVTAQIDLGDVHEIAEVSLNGHALGTAWTSPDRVSVGPWLRRGVNRLTVRVANLWVNRLIGDAQPGAVHVAQTAGPVYRSGAPLAPSGLLGPVRLTISQSPAIQPSGRLH